MSAGLHIAAPLMLLAMVEAGVSPRHGLRLKERVEKHRPDNMTFAAT